MEELEGKITKASKSTNARFKRKKIRSMKREADTIAEKLTKSEQSLKSLEPKISKEPISGAPLKWHPHPPPPPPPSRNKCIEAKIAELNKKIRRAKNRRNKELLITKRDSLRLELNWGPRQLEGAFCSAYRHYKIDGNEGMDVDTFFARTKRFLIDLLSRETRNRAVHSQATTWIRLIKDGIKSVELVFNSRMLAVYNLRDMGEIVSAMIELMQSTNRKPSLRDSKFVFDGVIRMDIDFHRLNLTRGSSCMPLTECLAKKGAIINPKNSDMECFKWAVIAATKQRDKEYDRVANLMLITDCNNKHYVAIKSLSRLLHSSNTKKERSQYFCINCLQGLSEKKSRDESSRLNEAVRIEMPNKKQ